MELSFLGLFKYSGSLKTILTHKKMCTLAHIKKLNLSFQFQFRKINTVRHNLLRGEKYSSFADWLCFFRNLFTKRDTARLFD